MEMEETYEQKKRRLFGKQHLPEYLEILGRLLRQNIHAQDLLSIVATDEFIRSTAYFKDIAPCYEKTIEFSDKTALKRILSDEVSDWNLPYTMYISGSLDCGLLVIPTLSWFDLDFSFDDDPGGLASFTRIDGEEHIVLDYYEERGTQYLEIQIKRK